MADGTSPCEVPSGSQSGLLSQQMDHFHVWFSMGRQAGSCPHRPGAVSPGYSYMCQNSVSQTRAGRRVRPAKEVLASTGIQSSRKVATHFRVGRWAGGKVVQQKGHRQG